MEFSSCEVETVGLIRPEKLLININFISCKLTVVDLTIEVSAKYPRRNALPMQGSGNHLSPLPVCDPSNSTVIFLF